MKVVLFTLACLWVAHPFTFIGPYVAAEVQTIGLPAVYTFSADRTSDPNLNPTAYNTQPLPANSSIIIVFPVDYNLTALPISLTSVEIDGSPVSNSSLSVSQNNLTISNAIAAGSTLGSLRLVVSNILNPSYAVTNAPFVLYIGTDVSGTTTISLSSAPFSSCEITFSPSTVNSTGNMQIAVTPTNRMVAGGYVNVQFPSSLQWSQDISTNHFLPISSVTCSPLTGQVLSASCSTQAVYAVVSYKLNSLNNTSLTTAFSFSMGPLFSPPTVSPPDTIKITSFSPGGYEIDTCTSTITKLQAQTMNLSLSSNINPLYVNGQSALTLFVTLSDTVVKDDYLQLIFPAGTVFTFTALSSPVLAIFTATSTYVSSNLTLVMRQSSTGASQNAGTVCKIIISLYTAPRSTKSTDAFTVQVLNKQNILKMVGTATFKATAKTYAMTASALSPLINANTSYTFTLTTLDPLSSSAMLILTFPAELTLFASSSCASSSNFSAALTPTCTSNGSNTIVISSLSSALITAGVYSITVSSVLNSGRTLTTGNFNVSVYYNSDTAELVATATAAGVTLQPKAIVASSISTALSNYHVLADTVSLNFTFTSTDALVVGSSLRLTIPNELAFVPNYVPQCTLFLALSTSPLCSLLGQTISVTLPAVSTGQTVTLQLANCCKNPASTRPTDFFKLYTYWTDSNMVDYSNNTYSLGGFLPIDFVFINMAVGNLTNSATSAYTFNVQQSSTWEADSYLLIKLPETVGVATVSCVNVSSSQTMTCSIISNSSATFLNVSLAATTNAINLKVSGLINPPTIQPSSSFVISTHTSDSYIYATDSTLSVTTSLPSSLPVASSFSSPYYNTSSSLTLTVSNPLHLVNQYTLTNFVQFSNNTNFTCSSPAFAVTCTINGSALRIEATNSSNLFPLDTTLQIDGLFVPLSNTTSMVLSSYANGYLASQSSSISFQPACTLPCFTCNPTTPTVCLTCYSTTIFTTKIYYYNSSCFDACPASSYAPTASLICLPCQSSCSECTLSAITCTECNVTSANPVLYLVNQTCVSSCPDGTYTNNASNLTKSTAVCSACQSPCATCSSATTCLTCSNSSLYSYKSQCIVSCPVNSSIANSTTMQCLPCAAQCLACVNTTTTCLACNSAVAPLFIESTSTCVSICPAPYVADSGTQCVSCSSPCASCSITKTNCTSCINSTFLSQITSGTCPLTCQTGYFGNTTTSTCQLCTTIPALHCSNCLSPTECISCDSGYVFFPANKSCLIVTPTGYVNISGIAIVCAANCTQCVSSSTNCSVCTGGLSLYRWLGSGSCVSICPNGTLSQSSICVDCTYPCRDCSVSLTNCTSCLTGYLWPNGSSSVCLVNCPNGTFINSITVACQNCISPCSTCVGGPSLCLTCQTGYMFNNTCLTTCPTNSIVNSALTMCQQCLSPCATCLNITNNCTSCLSNYYYYDLTHRCLVSCPVNVSVADNATFTCVDCTSNCLTCVGTSSNCSSCGQNYSFFNNSCLQTCPSGYYASTNLCKACVGCLTCTSLTSCLSCSNTTLLYQSTCITTCPSSNAIILNNTCTACPGGCLSCSSAGVCSLCPASLALYEGSCLSVCPSPLTLYLNSSTNRMSCFTDSQLTNQKLQQSLSISNVLPLPFTIVTTFLFLCTLMSKIQNIQTYSTGIGYSLYGCAEAGSLAYLFFVYASEQSTSGDYSKYSMLILIGLGIIGLLNTASLLFVTPFFVGDPEFQNWLNYRRRGTPPKQQGVQSQLDTMGSEKDNENVECWSHKFSFGFFTVFSFITSYKFRMLIFTKLFRFTCLTAHLEDVHSFRAFNVLSFFGILHEGLACYVIVNFIPSFPYSSNARLFLTSVDCLIVTIACFIFSLVGTQKQQTFFKVHNDKQVDLGHRKKDKDRLKNLKIDEKRMNGLNSRDKLIDINEESSDIEEQEIIVNHNIDIPRVPKKNTGNWVQRQEPLKRQRAQSPKKVANIFDIEQNEDHEDSFDPLNSVHERIELFHTSIPKKSKLPIASRVSDWVQVDIDKQEETKKQNKLQMSDFRQMAQKQKSSDLSLQQRSKAPHLNIESSIVKIQVKDTVKKSDIKQSVFYEKQPIIKETDSEYLLNSQKKSSLKSNPKHILSESIAIPLHSIKQQSGVVIIIPDNKKEVVNMEDLNEVDPTLGEGKIIESDKHKSFQSVLPFVHEDGILKEKSPKKKEIVKQETKIMAHNVASTKNAGKEKVDMAVVANSAQFEQPIKQIQNEDQKARAAQLQNLLDISEIKFEQKIQPTLPIPQIVPIQPQQQKQLSHQKSKQQSSEPQANRIKFIEQNQIRIEDSQPNSRLNGTQNSKIKPALAFTSTLSQMIQPNNLFTPVMHAPKVYKNQKQLDVEGRDEFDQKLNHYEEELTKIKEQLVLDNNRLIQKKQKQLDNSQRKRSKKSIKGEIEHAIKTKLIKNERNNSQMLVTPHQIDNSQSSKSEFLEEVIINPTPAVPITPIPEATERDPVSSQHSVQSKKLKQSVASKQLRQSKAQSSIKRPNISQAKFYEISERNQIQNVVQQMQERKKNPSLSSKSNRNIFDQKLYTENEIYADPVPSELSGYPQNVAPSEQNNGTARIPIKIQQSQEDVVDIQRSNYPQEKSVHSIISSLKSEAAVDKDVTLKREDIKSKTSKPENSILHSETLKNDNELLQQAGQDQKQEDSLIQASEEEEENEEESQSSSENHEQEQSSNHSEEMQENQQIQRERTPQESRNLSHQSSHQVEEQNSQNHQEDEEQSQSLEAITEKRSNIQSNQQDNQLFQQQASQNDRTVSNKSRKQHTNKSNRQENQLDNERSFQQSSKQSIENQRSQYSNKLIKLIPAHNNEQSISSRQKTQSDRSISIKQSNPPPKNPQNINKDRQQQPKQSQIIEQQQNYEVEQIQQDIISQKDLSKQQALSYEEQQVRFQQKSGKFDNQDDYSQQIQGRFEVDREERRIQDEDLSSKEKEFTVENVDKNYQDEQSDSRSRHIESIQMQKTSKRYPTARPPKRNKLVDEQQDHRPIELIGGKHYQQSDLPFDDELPANIKNQRNRIHINQTPSNDPSRSKDHQQVVDLLKNVTRNSSNKKKLPKQERDERILIKMNRNNLAIPIPSHENTNLARKSMQKNKPINTYKFQQKQEDYSEQESSPNKTGYRQIITKNHTMNNLIKPKNIDRFASVRQSKNASVLELNQTNLKPIHEKSAYVKSSPKQIRQFNFGDQISSQVSGTNYNSQAQLYKWKEENARNSYDRRDFDYRIHNEADLVPDRPLVNRINRFDEQLDDDQIYQPEIRVDSSLKRRGSKRSKHKSKKGDSHSKNSQLRKIYGK